MDFSFCCFFHQAFPFPTELADQFDPSSLGPPLRVAPAVAPHRHQRHNGGGSNNNNYPDCRLETEALLRRASEKVVTSSSASASRRARKCSTGDSGPSSEPDSTDSELFMQLPIQIFVQKNLPIFQVRSLTYPALRPTAPSSWSSPAARAAEEQAATAAVTRNSPQYLNRTRRRRRGRRRIPPPLLRQGGGSPASGASPRSPPPTAAARENTLYFPSCMDFPNDCFPPQMSPYRNWNAKKCATDEIRRIPYNEKAFPPCTTQKGRGQTNAHHVASAVFRRKKNNCEAF